MMVNRIIGLGIICLLLVTASCSKGPQTQEKLQAPEVIVDHPRTESLPETLVVTGRLEAVLSVDIRSRVTGYLDKVHFRDGEFVKKGDVLYQIDPRPYQAKLDVAKGEVDRLEGERKLAEIQVDRYKKLSDKGAASKQEYDVWIGKQAENLGAMAAAKAQVIYNELNLNFCKITSPIDGQISRTFLQIGNLINADNTSLTNLVSIDPIYVYVNIDEPTMIRVLKELRAGSRENYINQTYLLDVGLADDVERKFPFKAKLNFVNNQLDKQTGTITIRGEIANPYDPKSKPPKMPFLKPGMFARVKMPLSESKPRIMVPEVAVGNNQDRRVVWLVDGENKARMIEVEVGQKDGAYVAIKPVDEKKPISPDSLIVIKGIQRCRENEPVKPVKAEEWKPGEEKKDNTKSTPAKGPAVAGKEADKTSPPANKATETKSPDPKPSGTPPSKAPSPEPAKGEGSSRKS